jgi:diaminopimelate epimerase
MVWARLGAVGVDDESLLKSTRLPVHQPGLNRDNPSMQIQFTKMQGAGNDFVVLDETQAPLNLSAAQYRWLADRHFGVGADQILSVRPKPAHAAPGVDFAYAIHNADGGEVEHCGNGARCFLAFVRAQGLTDQRVVTVQTMNRVLRLEMQADDRVTVDMGAPVFDLDAIPFDGAGLTPEMAGFGQKWLLAQSEFAGSATVSIAVLSMGNPHAVMLVDDVDTAPVHTLGAWVEQHPRFARRVNVGFLQVVARDQVRLRVYERGAGETLACGTGACAAVVAGIRWGLLDARVDVQTLGGRLTIEWAGSADALDAPVLMTGPATTVFSARIEIPDGL